MNSDIKKFIFKLTVLTALLFIAGWIVFSFLLPSYYLPVFPFTLLLFCLVTAVIHIYQIILFIKNSARFARSNMVATTIKLTVYSLFTIVYLAVDPGRAIPFVVLIFILYLIFTIFEVSELTRLNRKLSKRG